MALKTRIGRYAREPEGSGGFRAAGFWLLLGVALAFLGGCAAGAPGPSASRSAATASPAAVPEERTVPFLWRATSPAVGDGVIHLFGSIHVGRPEMLDFSAPTTAAYDNAEELVVEVDLAEISDPELTKKSLGIVLLPEGEMLRDKISAKTYAALAESGLPMAAMDRMKPWAISTILDMSQFAAAGLEERYGVDRYFVAKAKGRRPVRGLETMQSQADVFDGLSWEIQELMLADSLERIGEDPSEIVDVWARGDEAALTSLIFDPLELEPRYEPFYEAVFFSRNDVMAAQLATLCHDGKKRFVVVGAGHLLGPRGIPAWLEQRGFRVERVPGP